MNSEMCYNINLTDIILSVRSQTQKTTHCDFNCVKCSKSQISRDKVDYVSSYGYKCNPYVYMFNAFVYNSVFLLYSTNAQLQSLLHFPALPPDNPPS